MSEKVGMSKSRILESQSLKSNLKLNCLFGSITYELLVMKYKHLEKHKHDKCLFSKTQLYFGSIKYTK